MLLFLHDFIYGKPQVICFTQGLFFNSNNTTMKKNARSLFSLFMSCQCGCIRQFKSDFNPETDLWQLCLYAYEVFRKDVLHDQKKYHRYVADVLSYNIPIGSHKREDWQVHSMNISRLYELLDVRTDLVEKYFMKDSFTKEDYDSMMREFMFIENPFLNEKERMEEMDSEAGIFTSVFMGHIYLGRMTTKQIGFITSFVNRIKLFTRDVTSAEMHNFFYCNLNDTVLEVNKTLDFVFFMDSLREHRLIVNKWQKLVAEHCMVRSASKKDYITRSQIRNTLYHNKNDKADKYQMYKEFAKSLVGR